MGDNFFKASECDFKIFKNIKIILIFSALFMTFKNQLEKFKILIKIS